MKRFIFTYSSIIFCIGINLIKIKLRYIQNWFINKIFYCKCMYTYACVLAYSILQWLHRNFIGFDLTNFWLLYGWKRIWDNMNVSLNSCCCKTMYHVIVSVKLELLAVNNHESIKVSEYYTIQVTPLIVYYLLVSKFASGCYWQISGIFLFSRKSILV